MPKLPLYEIKLSPDGKEDQGVKFVSLVKDPAIKVKWVAFAKANFHPNCRCTINARGTVKLAKDACETCREARRAFIDARQAGNAAPKGLQWISPDDLSFASQDPAMDFKFTDEEKRMLAGPFMIPNTPIYRLDEDGEEYNVFFTEATIAEVSKKFFKENRVHSIDAEHDNVKVPAYVVESWIVTDPENDKSKALGFSVPKGTWFGTVYVEDEKYWNETVKSGEVRGFSIQGLLSQSDTPTTINQKMSEHKFSAKTADGKMIGNADGSESLKVGDAVVWLNEDGSTAPVDMPEVRLEDGSVLVIADGKISEIRAAQAMADEKPAEEKMADPAPVTREEFDALKAEWATAMADLASRLGALEADAVMYKETMAKQSEQIKKFSSHTPGAKSVTLTKTEMKMATAAPKSLAALEAVANYRKSN